MNIIQLNSVKDALRSKLHELERITPACRTCEKFQSGICQHFGQSPPPEWQLGPVECDQWVHDGIPF
jgi:hypothetical protein